MSKQELIDENYTLNTNNNQNVAGAIEISQAVDQRSWRTAALELAVKFADVDSLDLDETIACANRFLRFIEGEK